MTSSLLFLTAVVLSIAHARIASFGMQTAVNARNELKDTDFVVDPRKGAIINTPNFRVQIADLSNFKVLGLIDVQSQIVRVNLDAGADFIPHFHPRGVEVLNAIRGVFSISITYEGLTPRKVTTIVKAGQSIPFPQGLIHETRCISRGKGCEFLSIFNTADPGLVPVTV